MVVDHGTLIIRGPVNHQDDKMVVDDKQVVGIRTDGQHDPRGVVCLYPCVHCTNMVNDVDQEFPVLEYTTTGAHNRSGHSANTGTI